MDTFYVTGMEKSPFAALYKGNMRGKDSEEVSQVSWARDDGRSVVKRGERGQRQAGPRARVRVIG